VRKHRILHRIGRTRVHLDRVHGLGDHLELEVVLDDERPDATAVAAGAAEAHRVMTLLGVDRARLIEGAYVDLLAASRP
jgi:adenylate cyclase